MSEQADEDGELLRSIARGDDQALAVFYRAHLDSVLAFFRRASRPDPIASSFEGTAMSDAFDQLECELRRGVRMLAGKSSVGSKQAARARWGRPALGGLLLALSASIAAVLLARAVYGLTELHRERGLTTITGSHIPSGGPEILDTVHTSDVYEGWANARAAGLLPRMTGGQSNTVHRITWYGSYHPELQRLAFVGAGVVGDAWAQRFRALYRAGQWRVVGHLRRGGRSLWMIEQDAAGAKARAREEGTRYYALVDPHTFLPVYTRLINVARPGNPTIYETELLSYRSLSATTFDQSLFDLAKQHPGSPVLTQAGLSPVQARRTAESSKRRRAQAAGTQPAGNAPAGTSPG